MPPQHHADFEQRLMETGGNPEAALMNAVREIARLKAGEFTPDEVQNLCHNLKQTVGPQAFADGCAAYQRTLYGYAPDRERSPHPLILYMEAQSRADRSAAFLRTYAARLLAKTAQAWEIPNTVAQTLTDIADLIGQLVKLRDHVEDPDDTNVKVLRDLQNPEICTPAMKAKLETIIEDLQDWDRSFALFDKASRALMHAFKAAHPEEPENVWPGTTRVTVWANIELQRLQHIESALIAARADVDDLRQRKDAAYDERNRVVAALSKVFPAHRARHPEEDASWERDWMTIVCIHSPAGQLTWHVHDTQVYLFEHLPEGEGHWDGHTTEEKYLRLRELLAVQWAPAGPGDIRTIRRALYDYVDNKPDGSRWARRNEHIADARKLLSEMPVVNIGYPPEEALT